jgi:predicted ester cyclase
LPDLRHKVTTLVQEGDVVAAEVIALGTYRGHIDRLGDWIGVGATPVRLSAVDFLWLRGEKVARWHAYNDRVELLEQLGIVPTPAS